MDGNAIAGLLSDVIIGDITTVVGVCGGCGTPALLAETVVELDDACAIVRCRACTMTLFTLQHNHGGTRLSLGSLRELFVP